MSLDLVRLVKDAGGARDLASALWLAGTPEDTGKRFGQKSPDQIRDKITALTKGSSPQWWLNPKKSELLSLFAKELNLDESELHGHIEGMGTQKFYRFRRWKKLPDLLLESDCLPPGLPSFVVDPKQPSDQPSDKPPVTWWRVAGAEDWVELAFAYLHRNKGWRRVDGQALSDLSSEPGQKLLLFDDGDERTRAIVKEAEETGSLVGSSLIVATCIEPKSANDASPSGETSSASVDGNTSQYSLGASANSDELSSWFAAKVGATEKEINALQKRYGAAKCLHTDESLSLLYVAWLASRERATDERECRLGAAHRVVVSSRKQGSKCRFCLS